jgi:hypothetical protein
MRLGKGSPSSSTNLDLHFQSAPTHKKNVTHEPKINTLFDIKLLFKLQLYAYHTQHNRKLLQ